MKKALIFFSIPALLLIVSCDKNNSQQQAAPPPPQTQTVLRKVLLENYHGHTCTNTPAADRTIDSLEAICAGRLITMNIHSGWFAQPCPPHPIPNNAPAGSFSENFQCTSADAISAMTGGGNTLPVATINRRGMPNWHLAMPVEWAPRVDTLLQMPAEVSVLLSAQLDTISNTIDVQANGDFITAQNGTFALAVMLVQDSLPGWQIDGSVYNSGYIFRNVLRTCMTDPVNATGVVVGSGSIAAMSPWNHAITNFPAPMNLTPGYPLYVIAFVYNDTTKEILQVEKAPVTL